MKTLNDIYGMTDAHRVRVDSYNLGDVESMSYMSPKGKCYIAIDPFKLDSERDEKVKLTHELGHCVQGAFYNQFSVIDIRERHEARAERWAIKQLIPLSELCEALHAGYCETWELAELFEVPEWSMRKAIEYYQTVGLL